MSDSPVDSINRLVELIEKEFGGNQSKLARQINVPQSTISSCLKSKKREINSGIISGFMKYRPDINIKWLLLGEGKMTNNLSLEERVLDLETWKRQMESNYERLFERVDKLAKRK